MKIVKAKVTLGRSFPTQELDAEFTPAPGPGWKTYPSKKHAGAAPVTSMTAVQRRVRRCGNTAVDETSPALSGADVTHRGESTAFMVTTSSRYVNTSPRKNKRPSKHGPEVVVESTRATRGDELEETDKNFAIYRKMIAVTNTKLIPKQ